MTLFLLLSCGSGSTKAEDPQSRFLKSIISLSNDFLNVFTSLSDMVGGVLGFNTNTKKSDVGNYFKTVQDTVQGTKDKLNKIVADMKSDNNPNASAVDTAVKALIANTLDKIIDGAKIASEAIGTTGDELLGNVAAAGNDAAAGGVKGDGIENLVKGIKSIVDVVLKGKGSAEAGDNNKASDGGARTVNAADGEAGKLFATGNGPAGDQNNSKKVATDAAKAVGAVTGADILQAMVKDGGAATLAKNSAEQVAGANAKDSIIAGGMVLRAIAKGGKFANGNNAGNADIATAIKGAATSAVTKALGTLTIAIRNTIDVGLKEVKDAMKFNSTDTPVTTDNQIPDTKKN
ncbi:variable large family protein (plasmid) [Borrelia parkeri]|uniref:variable large family protein n=1 Tax=Borrelia parkeri TaxID=141 RepID=UPI001FF24229|nr:variable large family protein [Borrelia parkeri]UPA11606.1 variable large family protein [Borrelia parkeri]